MSFDEDQGGSHLRKPLTVKTSPRRARRQVWITADGRRIKIQDMKSDHLVNTIKYCWRKYLAPLKELVPAFPILLKEARRRNLSDFEVRFIAALLP